MIFDIVIVGGGPAGLAAAVKAADNGLKVAVLERSKEIGYPVHTSGGSWVEDLQKLDIPANLYHQVSKIDFVYGQSISSFIDEKQQFCILDVRGLYQYLAEKASVNGAEIFVDATVLDPIIENDYVKGVVALIHGKKVTIFSNLVIDASGFSAVIAKKIGVTKHFESFASGAEYELIAPNWDQEKIVIIYGSRIAPSGYGWIIPRGDKRVRIGNGIIFPNSTENPLELLDKFLESDDELVQHLKPFSRIEFHHGIIPNGEVNNNTVSNGLIVVGDSACQVSSIIGEGIRFAIDIGRMAGQIANESILRKDTSEKFLKKYDRLWRKKYGKIFKISHELNKRFRGYTDEDWDRKVKYVKDVHPDIFCGFMKCDFNLKFIQKILKLQPSLLTAKSPFGSYKVISKYFKKAGE
jgi:digeranylgeranylglycerophospholipid reductase